MMGKLSLSRALGMLGPCLPNPVLEVLEGRPFLPHVLVAWLLLITSSRLVVEPRLTSHGTVQPRQSRA